MPIVTGVGSANADSTASGVGFSFSSSSGSQSWTGTSGTWTAPAGCTLLDTVECVGAGGGGECAATGNIGGGGGGFAGSYNLTITPGTVFTYGAGKGGKAGGTGYPDPHYPAAFDGGGSSFVGTGANVSSTGGTGTGGGGGGVSGTIQHNGGAGNSAPLGNYGGGGGGFAASNTGDGGNGSPFYYPNGCAGYNCNGGPGSIGNGGGAAGAGGGHGGDGGDGTVYVHYSIIQYYWGYSINGDSTATGISKAIKKSVGNAAGTSSALGPQPLPIAAGDSTAAAISAAIKKSVGNAAGEAFANSTQSGIGVAHGDSFARCVADYTLLVTKWDSTWTDTSLASTVVPNNGTNTTSIIYNNLEAGTEVSITVTYGSSSTKSIIVNAFYPVDGTSFVTTSLMGVNDLPYGIIMPFAASTTFHETFSVPAEKFDSFQVYVANNSGDNVTVTVKYKQFTWKVKNAMWVNNP